MVPIKENQKAAKASLQKALDKAKVINKRYNSSRMSHEDRIGVLCKKLKADAKIKDKERDVSRLKIAHLSADRKSGTQVQSPQRNLVQTKPQMRIKPIRIKIQPSLGTNLASTQRNYALSPGQARVKLVNKTADNSPIKSIENLRPPTTLSPKHNRVKIRLETILRNSQKYANLFSETRPDILC